MNQSNDDRPNSVSENPLRIESGFLTPFQRKSLQKSLTQKLSRIHRTRIEIMLWGDQGKTQSEICKALGCSQATARQWLLLARLGEAHRWKDISVGRPKQVNADYLKRLKSLIHQGPRAVGYSFKTWTGEWLGKHLEQEFGFKLSARHINRLLKNMGLSTRHNRPKTPSTIHQSHDLPSQSDDQSSALGDRLVIRDLESPSSPL